MTPKQTYDMLVENEELMVMYPEFNFTGRWREDKELFLKLNEYNEKAMKDAEEYIMNLDDDEDNVLL